MDSVTPIDPIEVPVTLLDAPYVVRIGSGMLNRLGEHVLSRVSCRRICIISDSNVSPLHAGVAQEAARAAGLEAECVTIPAGESSKSLSQAEQVFARLAEIGVDRSAPIIALGGGVVGDLSGFVAATWLRGVPFIQCPTTMEAAIDASVGGKTAVNLPAGKNLIGAFHQPVLVLIDIDTLKTLPPRELRAGLAESVKHALISKDDFLAWHESHSADILAARREILAELIRRNVEIKARVVVADERETGGADGIGRMALNLGHTIGHALEHLSGFAWRHGECVALGLLAALEIGRRRSLTHADLFGRVGRLLTDLHLPTQLPHPVDVSALWSIILRDKKASAGRPTFVLVSSPGTLRLATDVTPAEVAAALSTLAAD
jgi:3-dehydroquinate synthase